MLVSPSAAGFWQGKANMGAAAEQEGLNSVLAEGKSQKRALEQFLFGETWRIGYIWAPSRKEEASGRKQENVA